MSRRVLAVLLGFGFGFGPPQGASSSSSPPLAVTLGASYYLDGAYDPDDPDWTFSANSVTQWDAVTGQAFVADGISSTYPTYSVDASLTKGRDGIDCDAGDRLVYEGTGLPDESSGEVWIVWVLDSNGTSNQTLLALGDKASDSHYLSFRATSTTTGVNARAQIAWLDEGSTYAVEATTTAVGALATCRMIRWKSNGSAWTCWINGISQTLSTVATGNNGGWFGGITTTTTLAVGMRPRLTSSYVEGLNGKLCRVAIFPAVLTDADAATLEAAWAADFGITLP